MRIGWLSIVLLCCVGCPKQRELKMETYHINEPITLGKVELRVLSHGPQYALVNGTQSAYYTPRSVYGIVLRVTNRGDVAYRYRPGHGQRRVTDAEYPVLRDGRGQLIKHVFFGQRERVSGQRKDGVLLEPGASLDDLFLFEIPGAEAKMLWLSLPSALSSATRRVRVRFPVSRERATLPEGVPMNALRRVGALRLAVVSAKSGFPQVAKNGRTAFLSEPTLMIAVLIRNRGQQGVRYVPQRKGGAAPRLLTATQQRIGPIDIASASILRPRVLTTPTLIPPGKSIIDHLLFDMPRRNAARWLYLHFPLRTLGQDGLIRFRLPNPNWKQK